MGPCKVAGKRKPASQDAATNAAFWEEEGAAAPVAPSSLAGLMHLAEKAVDLERTVKDLEEALKQQKSALNHLTTVELPDAMAAVGLTDFTTDSGAKLSTGDFVAGALPKEPDKRKVALVQLKKEGGEDIIKNVITIQFDKKEHNKALALAADLRDQGYEAEVKSDVHPQTLMKFVRERLKKGEKVAADKLGCFVGRITKIKLPGQEDTTSSE